MRLLKLIPIFLVFGSIFITCPSFAYPPPISWQDGEPLQPGTPVRAGQISQLKAETEDAMSDCGLAFNWSQWIEPQTGASIQVAAQINLIRSALQYLYDQKLPGTNIPGQDVAVNASISVADISNIRNALDSLPLAAACAGPVCGDATCDLGETCPACPECCAPGCIADGGICHISECGTPNPDNCGLPPAAGGCCDITYRHTLPGLPGCTDETRCGPLCGNGLTEPPTEQCDDSNTTDGDGCSSVCQNEAGPTCGNNVREGTEDCDGTDLGGTICTDRGYNSGYLACNPGLPADGGCTFDESSCSYDSCWSRCTAGGFASFGTCPPIGDSCQPGWQDNTGAPYLSSSTACPTDGMICCCNLIATQYCYDGIKNYNEIDVDCGGPECLDCCTNGRMDPAAGEGGIDCGGPGCSSCCGNGTLDVPAGEQCDDANTNDGDGCSSTCQTEAGCVPTACDAMSANCGSPANRDDCGQINLVLCAGVRGTNPSICGACGPPIGSPPNICCTNGAARCGCTSDPTC